MKKTIHNKFGYFLIGTLFVITAVYSFYIINSNAAVLDRQKPREDPEITLSFLGTEKTARLSELNVDQTLLSKKIKELFPLDEVNARPARFFMDGKKLAIMDGSEGIRPNYAKLTAALKNGDTKITIYPQGEKPSPNRSDLEEIAPKISEKLKRLVTIVDPIYTGTWRFIPADHPEMLEFGTIESIKTPFGSRVLELADTGSYKYFTKSKEIKISLKEDVLEQYINDELSKWLDKPAGKVDISMDDNKKILISGESNEGSQIDRMNLKIGLEMAVNRGINKVTVPAVKTAPRINISKELRDMGIKEQLAVGHTSYYGSPANRVFNIKAGAEKFNGKLIAPGDTFSFNKTLGPVDGENGYKKELVITEKGTVPEYGGGICQVSTTFYRAALLSGLPITERHPHSYAVSYYSQIMGHGLDATIYLGGPDLKFTNDTQNSILMQAFTKNDYELYVVFYGSKDGRSVSMEGPYLSNYRNPPDTVYVESDQLAPGQRKVAEKAHQGFDALWYRHLFKDGREIVEEITTRYHAVPQKIEVGKAKGAE